jgi:hypothetical protein
MTEAEWLTSTDLLRMVTPPLLHPVWGPETHAEMARTERKRVLCCVAWLRSVWTLLVSEHSRKCVEVAEKHVDGEATDAEFDEALWMAKDAGDEFPEAGAGQIWATAAAYDIGGLPETVRWLLLCADEAGQPTGGRKLLAALLRDVFGNPFRPVTLNSDWLTSTVVTLAEGIYYDRAYDRLPVLADALQEAGCDNDDMLDHCRGLGPHVRGCWVVDLLLNKG